jgi:hypothetical protein
MSEAKACKQCGQVHTACKAHRKKKNGGGPCGGAPMENGVCYMHGGPTPAGLSSPNFKTGKYSRYKIVSSELNAQLLEARNDPRPLVLRDDIDLIVARINELFSAEACGSEDLWRAVTRAETVITEGLRTKDNLRFNAGMQMLRRAIEAGRESTNRWKEIERLIMRKRSLAQTDSKREVLEGKMVSLERVLIMMNEIAALIKENVHDRATAGRITNGLRRLAGVSSSGESA